MSRETVYVLWRMDDDNYTLLHAFKTQEQADKACNQLRKATNEFWANSRTKIDASLEELKATIDKDVLDLDQGFIDCDCMPHYMVSRVLYSDFK